MAWLSQRAYAKYRKERGLPGGSLAGVQHALSSGRIRLGRDGKIDSERADSDWDANTDSSKRRGPSAEESAVEPLLGIRVTGGATEIADAQREVVCLLLKKASELPKLLAALGAPVAAVLAAGNLFDGFLWAALGGNEPAGGLALRLWPRSGPSPVEEPADYAGLIGRAVTPADETAADGLLESVDGFFGNPGDHDEY